MLVLRFFPGKDGGFFNEDNLQGGGERRQLNLIIKSIINVGKVWNFPLRV
jgi:hypothetical protein